MYFTIFSRFTQDLLLGQIERQEKLNLTLKEKPWKFAGKSCTIRKLVDLVLRQSSADGFVKCFIYFHTFTPLNFEVDQGLMVQKSVYKFYSHNRVLKRNEDL